MSSAEDRPLITPRDRAALRAWLEIHHATSGPVRLAVGKKGNRVTDLTYNEAVEEGLCYGWIDGTTRRLDDDRYTVLFGPRRPGSTWAQSNKLRVERLTAAGLMTPAGLAAVEAAKADGSWDALDDVESLVVPVDLAAALDAVPGAAERFAGMTLSARKLALYWIGSAKRAETRAKRIAETVADVAGERVGVG